MVDAAPVQDMYRAFISRDFNALGAVLADDVMMDIGGKSRFAGSHRGRDSVVSVIKEMAVLTPKLHDAWDVCVSEHHAILMDWFEASRDEDSFLGYVAFVCAVENGKIARLFPFFEDQYSFDQFFAPKQTE